MIDFNSKTHFSDRLNFLIDAEIDKTAAESQRREYLGASVVGHPCERAVQFHLLAARGIGERKQPPARSMRIFDRGHTYEEKARRWLEGAGFLFGKARGFEDFGGQFRGHVDGVLAGWDGDGAAPIELPALWENKCLKASSWKKLKTERLKAYSSTYYAQVALYLHYLKLPRCLFTVVNADTMELHHELITYDRTEAELGRARVATVIAASDEGRLVARMSNDPNFYQCKWCDFFSACWST